MGSLGRQDQMSKRVSRFAIRQVYVRHQRGHVRIQISGIHIHSPLMNSKTRVILQCKYGTA